MEKLRRDACDKLVGGNWDILQERNELETEPHSRQFVNNVKEVKDILLTLYGGDVP